MKREARQLLEKALDSAVVAADHYNRLWERGRNEAVLIFLDRAFELLMKAIIVERGGKITSDRENELTIGSSEALRRCVSNEEFRCITGEEAISVQNLNLLRDAAQHYIVDVSEGQLYIYAQSGITIFRKLVADEFGDQKAGEVPDRLSLVSSAMPDSFAGMLDDEFEQLREMLAPGSRKRLDAKAKIRAMAVLGSGLID